MEMNRHQHSFFAQYSIAIVPSKWQFWNEYKYVEQAHHNLGVSSESSWPGEISGDDDHDLQGEGTDHHKCKVEEDDALSLKIWGGWVITSPSRLKIQGKLV